MRKIYSLALALFSVFSITLIAQHPARTSFAIPRGGVNDGSVQPDANVNVRRIEQPSQVPTEYQLIKDSLAALYGDKSASGENQRMSSVTLPSPVVGSNFAGNTFNNGTPTDNEVAIGNNGMLISVQNSSIFRYNTNTGTSLGSQSLNVFFSPLANNGSKYDPKVLYDPEANRFILVCLAGYLSSNTHIMIGFSNSDSINGTWNLYMVPGNPFNDTLWSDYPMIAVNKNELFVSVNLLHDNQPWQTGFVETVVWQLNKWDGYAGDSLRTELHSGINTNGRPVRNLCPVEHGGLPTQSNSMYFVSDRNLDASNDTIFLVTIADTANSPSQQVSVTMMESNRSYFAPIPADQPGTGGALQTNDARILGAMLINNRIQFVSATLDTATGNNGIYYGVISNPGTNPAVTTYVFSDTALDYGYPNIAWVGYDGSDNSSMIMFLHSSATLNPGYSVMMVDTTGDCSARTNVKTGLGPVSLISGDERWGDYTGIQRKYDVGGTCWVNGYYGLSTGAHATWVAEIGRSTDVGIAETNPADGASVYPNPFVDLVNISFAIEHPTWIRFVVYDMQGRVSSVLVEDQFKAGKHILSFDKSALSSGAYIVRAECADGSVLFTERIIRQ